MKLSKSAKQTQILNKQPPLEAGDSLDQPTFHQRYEAMPPGFRAELIGGMVIIPSRPTVEHGYCLALANAWVGEYAISTPGTLPLDNATAILGPEDEPQPDVSLCIRPGLGGQTRLEGKYLAGAPELVVEVASSSWSYDLNSKFRAYERAGVLEYVVVLLHETEVRWHVRRGSKLEAVQPGADGLHRSTAFPGLWLDPGALLRGDGPGILEALRPGLATEEHERFARGLAERSAND